MRLAPVLTVALFAAACGGTDLSLVLRESIYVELLEEVSSLQQRRQMALQQRADDQQIEALQQVVFTAANGALVGEVSLQETELFVSTLREILKDDVVERSEVDRAWDTLRSVYATDGPQDLLPSFPREDA